MKRKPSQQTIERQRDAILRADGFHDIESTGSDHWLKRGAPDAHRMEDSDAVAEYRRRALAFLHRHPWTNDLERDVWEGHAEGESFTELAHRLQCDRNRCVRIVDRFRALAFKPAPWRGRPRKPSGYGRDSYLLTLRLDERQANALLELATRLKVPPRKAVAALILCAHKYGNAPA